MMVDKILNSLNIIEENASTIKAVSPLIAIFCLSLIIGYFVI